VVRKDNRYAYEAYEFVFQALHHTQQMLNRLPPPQPDAVEQVGAQHHVSGAELVEGACRLALREFGLMARTVFRMWGIRKTDDFGEIVFNLIDAELLSRRPTDSRLDFVDGFDFHSTFAERHRRELDRIAHRG